MGAAWAAFKLFGFWGKIKRAVGFVWTWAVKNPLIAALVVTLCLLAWTWHGKSRALNQRDEAIAGRTADRKSYVDAEAEAAMKALAALRAQEAMYVTKAKDADRGYETQLATANTSLDSYIATHRVRNQTAGSPRSGATTSTEGSDTTVLADLPGGTVLVSEDDLRVCNANTTYAIGAHNWAVTLNQ